MPNSITSKADGPAPGPEWEAQHYADRLRWEQQKNAYLEEALLCWLDYARMARFPNRHTAEAIKDELERAVAATHKALE